MAIRKPKPVVRALYREMFRDALLLAWQEKKLWPFALFALLLQSGGLFDVLIQAITQFPEEARVLGTGSTGAIVSAVTTKLGSLSGWSAFVGYSSFAQGILLAALIAFAVYGLSVISQGALVYGLGTRIRGVVPTFRTCLTAGARLFAPIAAVNIVSLGLLWVIRFTTLIAFQLATETTSSLAVGIFTLAFVFFLLGTALLTTIHLFAVNRIVLNGEHAWPAIVSAYTMALRSMGIALEHAALLFAFAFTLNLFGLIAFLMAAIPLFIALITAAIFQYGTLVWFGILFGYALFVGIMVVLACFSTTFQYASWQRLAWRIEDRSALTKTVRVIRRLLGHQA